MTVSKTTPYNSELWAVGLMNLGGLGNVSHSSLGEALLELILDDISKWDLLHRNWRLGHSLGTDRAT